MANVENLYLRGKDAADRHNYEYAIALFNDVLRATPDHRNARIALRGCEMELFRSRGGGAKAKLMAVIKGFGALIGMHLSGKNPAKAATYCESYLVNDPTNIYVLKRLAAACSARGFREAASDTLEFARQRSPKNLGVLRRLGEAYHDQGVYDKAIRCFQEIVAVKPEDHDAMQRAKEISAVAHLKRSHMEESDSFRDSLRDQEQTRELLKEEKLVRSESEQDAELRRLIEAAEAEPDNAEAHARLGDACYRIERYADAEKAYRTAFSVGKKYGMREKMGNARIRQFEQIEHKAEDEVANSGESPAAVARFRDAREKRLAFCIKEYQFRRQQHPTDMKLAWRLGQYYFELGGVENIRQAIEQFQQTMTNAALKLQAQYMLGRCFAADPKTLDMAREQFEAALSTVENSSSDMAKTLTYEIASIAEQVGDTAGALGMYKKIFAVDAGFRDVSKKIQTLG